jgi:hypothetical protein
MTEEEEKIDKEFLAQLAKDQALAIQAFTKVPKNQHIYKVNAEVE